MTLVAEHAAAPVAEILASSHVLAVLDFDPGPRGARAGDPRHVVTGMPSVADAGAREVWRSLAPVTWGWDGAIGWAKGEHVLFATTSAPASAARDLEAVTFMAWQKLLEFCAENAHPHILRAWNHIPRINVGVGDGERYKRFCAGRARAFDALGIESDRYPAASAVGNQGDTLVVYLLASSEPGRHYENPRQVSAFAYPRRYGPSPPSFARATVKTWPTATHVYVSGTASIVGHRSRRPRDVAGQLAVTLANIEQLMREVDGTDSVGVPDLLRVYLRDPADLPSIADGVRRYAPDASVIYVRGDICRTELLLEIEGASQRSAALRDDAATG